MVALIERGHVYIAQPPLYKVKKGKQEQYVKDELELNNLLLQMALEDARLMIHPEAPPVSGEALEDLARRYIGVMGAVDRLARRHDRTVLERMVFAEPLDAARLQDPAAVRAWFDALVDSLRSDAAGATRYTVRAIPDGEGGSEVHIVRMVHGAEQVERFGREFFASPEFRAIRDLAGRLDGLLDEGAHVQRGERRQPVSSFREVMDWLLGEARRGLNVQRYKGLGEMNPEQLWETTMNPDTRRLLQVKIEDAVRADEVFTTLMGDQVEPRREFIESNALTAANIDI
jgi:DNA gyrase subunit B